MSEAIRIAGSAEPSGNYRIGAIVMDEEMEVIGSAFTELHSRPDPTAHAEILALRRACAGVNSRYLPGCFLYTTLEPCPMCTSAAIWAKVGGIVYGAGLEDASDFARKSGPGFSWRQIDIKASYVVARGTPVLQLHERFMRDECLKLI
ncbi:tRNA-specific adenosine deaminase [Nonomuraea coxensis DSM 45129]|uniref:tRNA-specific adenosine deaminase n=1 Tax=Nonomuraea coxensis DSM 45129 TaxID=1122611 RepID=A0ABX8TU95_9ACTN|nr:nucleoside deaminase [Nonomuraea coxensis]QYC39037.1 tRNA-specific adenosine deaminase [Nonomuraea coxensis DSM 45129]